MQVEHGVRISSSTFRRRLRKAGLNGCKAKEKPRLTARHRKFRLEFVRLHKNWTPDNGLVWSIHESIFRIHWSDGRVYVRQMVGEALNESCVPSTVQRGGDIMRIEKIWVSLRTLTAD